ncbi:LOW QUALITY PROTEIN: hypothetical protein Cgig2_033069 [Carnegiea gigantea]|uniref:Cyclopropane-fatty-acyl-phospholipid synthase n=1 Tax=Carnegiea gigantea TaxID=171969 RepID=A0A9Q1JLN2_9CARY|nr:LOW QUALITY PROTEIN: hypothetical protein Cgig2_033069 [Carnegiea gigantea]
MTELFDSLGIDTEASDVSFPVSLDRGLGYEWGSRNGLRSLFAQKSNLLKPNFWKMLRELKKFKNDAIMYLEEHENNQDLDCTESLGHFIKSHGYSEFFQKVYLVPVCASIWSCSSDRVMDFSAFSVLSFCRSYHLLQLSGHPQWLNVRKRSHHYVKKLREELEVRGSQIRTGCEVYSVSTSDNGQQSFNLRLTLIVMFCLYNSSFIGFSASCRLFYGYDSQDIYDGCIMAVPAPDVIKILGKEAMHDEMRILGAFHDIFLHHDESFMPSNPAAWSAWNFLESTGGEAFLTYWLNVLQNISETSVPFLATVNPPYLPKNVLLKWSTGHLIPSVAAAKASREFNILQGKRGICFFEAYHGNGSYEGGLKAGMMTAHAMLGRRFTFLRNPKQMVPSWTEAALRHYVIRFFKHFISAGCLTLLEEGGTALTFKGSDKRCTWKSALRVHNSSFYWKVATEGDLGLADAFINGDISFVDKNEGLLNFFMVILANLYLYPPASEFENRSHGYKGGWRPIISTAAIASAKYLYQHEKHNCPARQNVARHYDLSNEMFSLLLDETMTYSCAIFKAKVEEHHELLEIGCGWGSLAIEVVKKTGCRYTGITLAEEHEMLEEAGDEYYEKFFRQCESVLGENGILVIQTISIPDQRYGAHIRSSDFMKEYIFPGGCLPSLSRITSAMAAASRLCVEHVENIGGHYSRTLRFWRKKFLENQREICLLGFDEKFLRVWEYHFDYCASGFMTRTTADYQVSSRAPCRCLHIGGDFRYVSVISNRLNRTSIGGETFICKEPLTLFSRGREILLHSEITVQASLLLIPVSKSSVNFLLSKLMPWIT